MLLLLRTLLAALRALLRPRASLVLENLALRQQLAVLNRTASRPRLRRLDRLFWALLVRLWSGWRSCLVVVKPETVVAWHRAGFRLFWRWRSRRRDRSPIAADTICGNPGGGNSMVLGRGCGDDRGGRAGKGVRGHRRRRGVPEPATCQRRGWRAAGTVRAGGSSRSSSRSRRSSGDVGRESATRGGAVRESHSLDPDRGTHVMAGPRERDPAADLSAPDRDGRRWASPTPSIQIQTPPGRRNPHVTAAAGAEAGRSSPSATRPARTARATAGRRSARSVG